MSNVASCGCCSLILVAPWVFLGLALKIHKISHKIYQEKQEARRGLNRLLQEFVFGGNRTKHHVNRIYVYLADEFVHAKNYQDLIRATGSFVPGGDPPFLNEEKLAAIYARFLKIPLPEAAEGVWPPPPRVE